jgi:type IV secretory pathway ATPase VirB11/archaellum biosynthesis ATPase
MSLAGALLAKTDKSLLDRCILFRKGVMVYRNYATDICITDDGEYVVVDPQLPEVLERALALTALRGAVPPDYSEYDKAMRSSLSALAPGRGVAGWRWYRNALRAYREHRELVYYFLDRWSGRGEFGGYGVLEVPMRDDLLTEIAIPQPLAPPGRWSELPRDPVELLDKIYSEAVEFGRYRRAVAVRNEARMPTNVVIPEAFMPIVAKKLVPSLTLERPFQTKEDSVYRLRIAADLLEFNVNIRKMSEPPRPSRSLLRVYEAPDRPGGRETRPAERDLSALEVFALATVAAEARWTVIFSGAMGTGKTTQLNLLLYFIPPWMQVVVVERGAREIWAPLEGQILHISVPSESRLMDALDQALRYGTMSTVVALAEARTSQELNVLVSYKLTGHGGLTTMHADTIHDALLRIKRSGAPVEALANTMILQLGASGSKRYLKEWRALTAAGGEVAEASVADVLALLDDYTKSAYDTDVLDEVKIRAGLLKAIASKELEPLEAREALLKLFSRRKISVIDDAVKHGYQLEERYFHETKV